MPACIAMITLIFMSFLPYAGADLPNMQAIHMVPEHTELRINADLNLGFRTFAVRHAGPSAICWGEAWSVPVDSYNNVHDSLIGRPERLRGGEIQYWLEETPRVESDARDEDYEDNVLHMTFAGHTPRWDRVQRLKISCQDTWRAGSAQNSFESLELMSTSKIIGAFGRAIQLISSPMPPQLLEHLRHIDSVPPPAH